MDNVDLSKLDTLRSTYHAQCAACNGSLYRLHFTCEDGKTLVAQWEPKAGLGSYANTLHGGVQSLLIDEAMTCCLMAHGVVGVTADLRIRYRHPITLDKPIEIHTHLTSNKHPIYQLQTKIIQQGQQCVLARGKFMSMRK